MISFLTGESLLVYSFKSLWLLRYDITSLFELCLNLLKKKGNWLFRKEKLNQRCFVSFLCVCVCVCVWGGGGVWALCIVADQREVPAQLFTHYLCLISYFIWWNQSLTHFGIKPSCVTLFEECKTFLTAYPKFFSFSRNQTMSSWKLKSLKFKVLCVYWVPPSLM